VQIGAEVKREIDAKEGEKVLRTERFYGKTARRFSLPVEIDEAKVEAKFVDGVLELTLPKKAAAAGRKISIQ
jgi:HSP20 family protein